ncbi:hypothetical protein BDW60DRAFT_179047 [Aspergillus nidulans var. acristatus]
MKPLLLLRRGLVRKSCPRWSRHQLMLYTTWFEYSQAGYLRFIEVGNLISTWEFSGTCSLVSATKDFPATLTVTLKP